MIKRHELGSAVRKWIAIGMCCLMPASIVSADQQAAIAAAYDQTIAPVRPQAPVLWRPYLSTTVPIAQTANSPRLKDLIRAGKLYLTAQDAITLALENNIDLEIVRYNPFASEWALERSEAGGALPGVPSSSSQVNSVASGQGVLGSQAAAGVSVAGAGATRTNTTNATISQIGPVTQTLDPSIQEASTFSHRTLPQANTVQSVTSVLIQNQKTYTGSYQQGFLTGGSVTASYSDHYLNENAPTDVLNPSSAPNLSVQVQQSLLRGLGVAVNGRTITVAKINLATSELNFKTQVIGTVVSVLNAYYALVADYEDISAKQSALDTSRQFLQENRRRVEVGTLAELDVTSAESALATSEQGLVDSRSLLRQDELRLKNLISRTGIGDPEVASAQIVPLDRLTISDQDDLPSIPDLVRAALANRTDLAAEKASLKTSEINALGTKNGILPTAQGFANTSNAGLAGTPHTVQFGQFTETADPYFVGGIGTALGQVFRRNFPSQGAGIFAQAPLENRQAQADYGIDQLQLRQSQLVMQKDLNQAEVDVMNSVVALRQARARYEAAAHNRILDQQLFDAEQKKFQLGASTPYNVVQQQRDLIAAQSSEIADLVTYRNARISLDQTTGRTLEANGVSIADARTGKVARSSGLPAQLPNR